MPLVPHAPEYRRIWMFPRNIRYIAPWKVAQILRLLMQEVNADSWSGNQNVQDQFTRTLEETGLKRPGHQYDAKSGGARTYLSQLESLGLIFRRQSTGRIHLTIAGEKMVSGDPPPPIIQKRLLRHQYPSVYSRNRNVRIHPEIRIRPFLFVLKLMEQLEYLTYKELAVAVLYGHNDGRFDICTEKILLMRNRGARLIDVIDSPGEDLYTPRTKRRSVENALKDIKDIANTCANYLKAACLIESEREDGQTKLRTAQDYYLQGRLLENEPDPCIALQLSDEQFQRRYGRYDRSRDNRIISDETAYDSGGVLESIITSHFFQYAGSSPVSSWPDDFIDLMSRNYGIHSTRISRIIRPLMTHALSYFESTYIDMSKSGGTKAIDFEETTGRLFRDRPQFTVEHTGQKRKTDGRRGGYADLMLIALDDIHCALIDTKSTPFYRLGVSDYRAMVSDYIPNYRDLVPESEKQLEFCAYVAGGFHDSTEGSFRQMTQETGIPATGISAHDLLRICDAQISQEEVRAVFRRGGLLQAGNFNE